MHHLVMTRLIVLALGLSECMNAAWYFSYWDLFPKYSLRRLIPWLIFVLSGIGVPVAQILLYRGLTLTGRLEGLFVPVVVVAQSAITVAIALCMLKRRREHRTSITHADNSRR